METNAVRTQTSPSVFLTLDEQSTRRKILLGTHCVSGRYYHLGKLAWMPARSDLVGCAEISSCWLEAQWREVCVSYAHSGNFRPLCEGRVFITFNGQAKLD